MEKSCKDIEQMLVDYADGQLSPSDSNKVAEHLAICEHCRKMLNGLQKSLELAGVIWTDAHTETENVRIPAVHTTRRIHWTRYAAIAASILLLVTTYVVWQTLTRPTEAEPTFAEIEREIIDEGTAARLLAATDLLASKTHTRGMINSQYEYIVVHYPNTKAAARAKIRTQ